MDYGTLPPEINSARMYSGAGAGPMLAAAAAWDELAAGLHSTAAGYQSVISNLTCAMWQGAAAATMAAAAAPYVMWMSATATGAERAGAQAKAAAIAYETAFAMTVPPPLIAGNRAQLMALVATNVLGQNTPAIAANEAEYGEMWAQDAAAMYGYAGSSAAASTLAPFTAPPRTTNPAGQTIMSVGPQLISAVPQALQGLTSPSSVSSASALSTLSKLSTLTLPARFAMYPLNFLNRGLAFAKAAGAPAKAATAGAHAFGSGVAGVLGSATGAAGSPAGLTSASLGRAVSMGPLSVPQAWAAGVPTTASVTALPVSGVSAAPITGTAGAPPLMPIASMAGRGAGAPASSYDIRPSVIPRSPAAG